MKAIHDSIITKDHNYATCSWECISPSSSDSFSCWRHKILLTKNHIWCSNLKSYFKLLGGGPKKIASNCSTEVCGVVSEIIIQTRRRASYTTLPLWLPFPYPPNTTWVILWSVSSRFSTPIAKSKVSSYITCIMC